MGPLSPDFDLTRVGLYSDMTTHDSLTQAWRLHPLDMGRYVGVAALAPSPHARPGMSIIARHPINGSRIPASSGTSGRRRISSGWSSSHAAPLRLRSAQGVDPANRPVLIPHEQGPALAWVRRHLLTRRTVGDHHGTRLVLQNGASDFIYVGTRDGMWSRGAFDLTIDGEHIFTGQVQHLLYEGVVIQMGDVLAKQPESNSGVHITRVTGTFQ